MHGVVVARKGAHEHYKSALGQVEVGDKAVDALKLISGVDEDIRPAVVLAYAASESRHGFKGAAAGGADSVARTACTYNNIPLDHCHFLDLPFYETGKIQKNPISEADVEIVRNLLREVKPHQIFVAGDLADPHGTHRVCTDAVFAAIDLEKEEGAKWLKECRIWMYRGAWAEWEIENIEMAVPISPEELRAKRNSILKHQSQMESAPFLGNDERLFWQRSEDRNRGTAALYDSLGLASYEAMEAFVEYIPL